MFQAMRTRIALAVVTAVMVGTSIAPVATALAAPAAPDQQYASPKPDISVKLVKQDPYGDNGVLHWYLIENVGQVPTSVVAVKAECKDSHDEVTIATAKVITGFSKGEQRSMYFICDSNWGARITVGTQGDTHTINNSETYGFF